jgi:hypothetical protein
VGDDGLMSQSSFDINIKEKDYISSLCPDPHLFVSCMPSDDQIKKHYTKLLEGVIELRQILSRGKTLSAIRRRGELMDLKIADISAKDVMLEIDDAEFQDWCTNNKYARLWHCSQVNKSAILQLAIKNTILRSPHPHLATFVDDLDDVQPQFVGFVTAQIQHNVVTGLHIHSFALYYTQNMVLETKPTKTTVVICAHTSRIHILAMMQDRVFQLVQLLQHDVTGDYSMSLTNQYIGTDVVLNDLSVLGYADMGFNVKSMTQDVQQGQFTINTEDPIPLMPYSDRFTWAKYGHFILYSGLIPVHDKESHDKSVAVGVNDESVTNHHRDCLITFLRTDPDGAASFVVDARSARLIDEFMKSTLRALTKGTEKGYFFDKEIETNADLVISSVFGIAKEATKIPFTVVTDLFHHRFKKKPYLESTLELLQQFYIKLADHSKHYCIFVGDLHKYCLHCTRCHRAITRPDYIGRIMEMAPMAMLWHLGIASDADDFYHCPLILPLPEVMEYSWTYFETSMEEIDDKQHSPFLRCNAIVNHGMLSFCEATKVDLQSRYNSKKNGNKTHDSTISNTISLVSSLFVDMIDVKMAIQSGFSHTRAKMKETPITVENSVIWNRGNSKENKRFLCEPIGYNPSAMTRYQLEQLRLFESWCAFCHNEYTKNLLCVLEEIVRQLYGPSALIPNRFFGLFALDHEEIKSLVTRRSKNQKGFLPYQFKTCLNDVDDIIIGGGVVVRPLQFPQGTLPSMTSILEKQGSGWDNVNEKTFFNQSEGNQRQEVVMSTSKEYEECFIMFSTMSYIQKTVKNKDKKDKSKIERSFEIHCLMKNFEVSNDSLRKRHPGMFRTNDFYFCLTNELVKSMPFDFVNGLKDGKWTKLDNKWLKDVKKTLKQAGSNSIKDVVFVRTIMKSDTTFTESNLLNKDDNHIYQVTMDNDAQTTFYVTSAQIMDIIGDEEWMKGEMNCICNIASNRKVTLTWGAKKKSSNRSQLSIGDDVFVSNHGTKWEHRAKILKMNDDGISVLVKWETSLKREYVFLNDCRRYDVEETSLVRKRKATDFFVPMASEEIVQESEPDDRLICADGQVENIFFNPDNLSKQCAQGAVANLLNMLQCSKEELDLFWHLANSDVGVLEKELCQQVPKIVQKSFDSIEKCMWILRKQFKFNSTSKLNLKRLTSLKHTLKMLEQMKIPVLIGVSSTHSCYDHAVVIWNGVVIDYESMYTYPLTEESLRQVCGTNTTFQKVTSGYGLFPPKHLRRKVNNLNVTDWGLAEYDNTADSSIRGYFL